jgi:hypothetical protein
MDKHAKNTGQQHMAGIEADLEKTKLPPGMPTFEMIKTEITRLGFEPQDAEAIYQGWLASGFRLKSGKRIQQWKAAIQTKILYQSLPSQQGNELNERTLDRLEKRFPKLNPIRDFLPAAREACYRSHLDRRPMGRRFFETYLQNLAAEPPGLIEHHRHKPALQKEAARDRAQMPLQRVSPSQEGCDSDAEKLIDPGALKQWLKDNRRF